MGKYIRKTPQKPLLRAMFEKKAVEWAKNYVVGRMAAMSQKWTEQQQEAIQRRYLDSLLAPNSHAYEQFKAMMTMKIDNL